MRIQSRSAFRPGSNPNGWKEPLPPPTSGVTLFGIHMKLKSKRDFVEENEGYCGFCLGPFYVRTFREKLIDWTKFAERELRIKKG